MITREIQILVQIQFVPSVGYVFRNYSIPLLSIYFAARNINEMNEIQLSIIFIPGIAPMGRQSNFSYFFTVTYWGHKRDKSKTLSKDFSKGTNAVSRFQILLDVRVENNSASCGNWKKKN